MSALKRTAKPQATITTGIQAVTIRLPVILHQRIKIYCAQHGLKIQDFMAHIIALHLHEHTTGGSKK